MPKSILKIWINKRIILIFILSLVGEFIKLAVIFTAEFLINLVGFAG